MNNLVILQTVVPDYRKKVFQYIKDHLKESFTLFGGNEYFENSVKTDRTIVFLQSVNNHFLFSRKLLFQTEILNDSLNCSVLVLEMNPRIISNWLLLILRNFSRKKTVLWGHAWPRKGKNSSSDKLRHIMRLLASEIIVYTNTQKKELQLKMPKKIINAAPNAVFYKAEMQVSQTAIEEIHDIIYVGRLTKAKKALFLVQAFIEVVKGLPNETNLIIVGEGEEKSKIIKLVSDNSLENRIKVLGHIGNYDVLKKLYSTCLFSVSPGYVGLSITQSFGFGIPMLISRDENHSPEIESVKESENSEFFETDNLESLKSQILLFYHNKNHWLQNRKSISDYCKDNYSVEEMAKCFIQLL